MNILLLVGLLVACSHQPEMNPPRTEELLARMGREEKYRVLRSYRFLRNLAGQAPGRMPISKGHLPGIPRLGIPAIVLVGHEQRNRRVARDERALRVGFVNLIRDFQKTQVFGNFSEAPEVDAIFSPGKKTEIKEALKQEELNDLDLFLVQIQNGGRREKYVCAQYRRDEDLSCVRSKWETILKQLGIVETYDQSLADETLRTSDLDRLVSEVLNSMNELRLL